ncbi:MAG: motility associated factor glycosyltransferase family protein [Candidatus Omnitrophica bacterium]|nr:motility associated factor glycosyltransferase family protein [Candidatus Omnitrophota bacterium]
MPTVRESWAARLWRGPASPIRKHRGNSSMGCFEQNLAALASTRPALAAAVKAAHPDPDRYKLLPTQSGLPSLEWIQDDGEALLWYSRYDPMREIRRELSTIDHSRIYLPLLGGVGLGYSLRALWQNYRDEFFDAIVLEPDPAIFRLALQTTRMDDILADSRLHIHLGGDLNSWMELIHKLIPSIMSCALQFLPHRPSQKRYSAFFQSALDALRRRIQFTEAEFDLLIRNGSHIQENMWENLPGILSSFGLSDVRGMLRGKSAIVVAAGPSLDKNADQLRGVENRAALIAVDTAHRTLRRRGVEPHIVVTTDPTELNAKHFEDVDPSPRTILAFDPEVYSAIPSAWPHRKLFLNLEKASFTRWLEKAFGPFGFLPKGSSVGHTAFYLARELGADPIVFVGLDLAFDPQGGATHAADAALHRSYAPISAGAGAARLGPRAGAGAMQESIVWTPGIHGAPVPTSKVMFLYIQQFVEEIRKTSARVVDATEGGALLHGAETAALRDALSSFGAGRGIVSLFDSLGAVRERRSIRSALDPILAALENAPAMARRGLELTQRISKEALSPGAVRDRPEWKEMESLFSTIYYSEEIKIALEQALFSAVYSFIQKERADQTDLRLSKYRNYFQTVLDVSPHFRETILRVKSM